MAHKQTQISATWQGDMAFKAEDADGGVAQLGVYQDASGIRPMAMVLAALAGCAGVDVVGILKKKRVNFTNLKINVSGVRANTHPKVYTDIMMTFFVWGTDIKPKDVEQAIQLSEEKYCSVSAMLKSSATIHTDFRILAPGEEL